MKNKWSARCHTERSLHRVPGFSMVTFGEIMYKMTASLLTLRNSLRMLMISCFTYATVCGKLYALSPVWIFMFEFHPIP